MTLYTLHQLKQHYNHRLVLDIDHLTIEEGSVLALLGPNGAGKTTLLNILGFLDRPSSGSVVFQGHAVGPGAPGNKALELLRRQVVVVDQHPIMFSTSVSANIAFGLKIRSIPRKERDRIIDEVLELAGLSRYRSASAHELSGGETQRLALARALALKPRVLLCDEPTASADAENQAIVINLLHQINSEQGTTILFTTHDRLQAVTLAKQTLVLEQGRLVESCGENSFTCTVRQDAGGRYSCLLRKNMAIPLPQGPRVPPGQQICRVLIAPEKIVLQRGAAGLPGPDQAGQASFTGHVVLIMIEGKWVRVLVDTGVTLAVRMTEDEYRQQCPAVGDMVTLLVPAEALTLIA